MYYFSIVEKRKRHGQLRANRVLDALVTSRISTPKLSTYILFYSVNKTPTDELL